ncbi:hypothetical protein M409DRAFT_25549 [Zasmidium cellare ATCC 36951]|uniref:Enoyl reductase (ER) domain-containing protein n=1 Tax=Zasmidium cellare ATCC 36951 TaxID=1080233 RepID=A0A6A6CAI9_ZASCE|nr:uncharacterized protein M409DRAFT_25549 [Zasmidium cellare ATCC 36951]KAF2164207.1 hypothetical protein M409DRAFT_25549 [Zasmidium cellare ATCC 36951]
MQAVRIHPNPSKPWGPENPAPSSALHLDSNIPIPKPSKPGDVLVRVKATTLVRDTLTWPEMLAKEYLTPGNDFAGVVEAVVDENSSELKPGDNVFGMINADHGGAWAQYALVDAEKGEIARKPPHVGFEEAASVPLSALTAWQALFHKGGIAAPSSNGSATAKGTNVLIIGASGNVGIFLVQLAALAGCHVIAASTSNARNEDFLKSLGASEVVEYSQLWARSAVYDVAVDTVGGEVLSKIWPLAAPNATLVSVDSASYDFVKELQPTSRQDVKAIWFIVWSSQEDLTQVAAFLEAGTLKTFVSATYPIEKVQEAYEVASGRSTKRGKIILTI